MSVGINTAPLSPEESDARLALGILEQSNKISPEQAKRELRTLLEKSNEMFGSALKSKDLDRRVEVALTRALNCIELQTLNNRLRENLEYRPSFLNENERTSTLIKTVPNKTVTKVLIRNWIQLQDGIVIEDWQRIEKNVVAVSQLWSNLKQNVERDLEEELNKLVGSSGSSFEFGRKKRTEKLFEIMRLPNDPNAILQQVSKANRPIATRFPEVCKTHVESCGETLKEDLIQRVPWEVAFSKYQESMKELNNKLNFLLQAEEATRQIPVSQSSLEQATHVKDTTLDNVQTIDKALHQVMREIYTWSDGILLNGQPFKITTLIQILGIPINAKYKEMTESELAKYLATSGDTNFVNEALWKDMSPQVQKGILQHLFCFTATMMNTVPIQKKFVELQSGDYRIQISQSKGTEKEEENRELYRPYTGEFTLKRSDRNASGFEITGVMEKTYQVILSEGVEDLQKIGILKGFAKIDSNETSNAQVMYRFGEMQRQIDSEIQLKAPAPLPSDAEMRERLEDSVGRDIHGVLTGIFTSPDSALQSRIQGTRVLGNIVNVNFIDPNTGQDMQQLYTLRRTFAPNPEGGWILQSEQLLRAGDPRALRAVGEPLSGERLPEEPDALEIEQNKMSQLSDAETKYLNENYADDTLKPPVIIHTQDIDTKFDT